ncbi:MAG: enoyl-CoA hydratase/isomerase family protein [Chloroflexi bacterium]|nr:enoyl-CoA hydratase/isomerase family protein [Chloroflexota bacterium]
MESEAPILYHAEAGVATITLNRPARLNAITWPMMERMLALSRRAGSDQSIRVLVFKGNGRAFSSGDDIVDGMGVRSEGGDPEGITADRGLHYELVKCLLELPKPTVAAIHGRCHGAAWVISLACDFRVGSTEAVVGDIRAARAIFAGQSAPLLLPRLIGQSRAMDLLMTGRVIDAAEAERIGYFTRLWPRDTYERELQGFLDELASGPTRTYAAWKLTVNRSVLLELDGYTDYERALADKVRRTEDSAEGRASFKERRVPRYRGL